LSQFVGDAGDQALAGVRGALVPGAL